MTDNEEISERLRRAHAAEPAPVPDPMDMLRAGHRARRRRTAARWSAASVTCAGALVAALTLAGGSRPTPDQVAEPSPEETPSFLPVTVLDAYGGLPDGVERPFVAANGVEEYEAEPPIVDLAAGTVTIWTSGSYSCPTWPKAIRASGDTIDVVVGLPDGADVCTMDASVDTYVVELPAGYEPLEAPTVRVLHQRPGGSDEVPRSLPADDAGGCRPALTVCAMQRWLSALVDAAGLDSAGDDYGRLEARKDFRVGEDRVSAWLTLPERDFRSPIEASRTTTIGAVAIDYGISSDGVVPLATLHCGGFQIRLDGAAWMSADVLAQAAEQIAAAITECPANLDEIVALYPDLGGPAEPEQVTDRPAGCPEPLPDNLAPEEADAYAGRCLVPDVFGKFEGPGFMGGGLIDGTVSDDIFIYWYGEIDPVTQALIDRAAADGVRVEVRPVPYSEDQLLTARGAISTAVRAEGITVGAIDMGYERIEVTIADPLRLEEAQELAQAAAGDIPVTVVVGDVSLAVLY